MMLGIKDTVLPISPQVFTVALALLSIFQEVRGEGASVCSPNLQGGTEYMCADWSVGSATMMTAQGQYASASGGDAVIFGIGSYGSEADGNMGKCYRFTLDTGASDIIAQVTNFGADIASNQFDMQMGGGGFGVWNACAGPTYHVVNEASPCDAQQTDDIPVYPLYSFGQANWGERCGGQKYIEGCPYLPDYPTELQNVPNQEPTLIELCQTAFNWNVRKAGDNAIITNGYRVPCPDALVAVTNLKRNDDSAQETVASSSNTGVLTSTMDCCAPAGSYSSNTNNNGALPGYNRLVPCDRTGYTRSTE